jgi:hypothetical protein
MIRWQQGSTRRGAVDIIVSIAALFFLASRIGEMDTDAGIMSIFAFGNAYRGYIGLTHDDNINAEIQ